MNFDTTEINRDDVRESFAIQSSLVMHELERLIIETDRILRDLGVSNKPFSKLNTKVDTKVDTKVKTKVDTKVDAYKCVLEDASPRKRIKIE